MVPSDNILEALQARLIGASVAHVAAAARALQEHMNFIWIISKVESQ